MNMIASWRSAPVPPEKPAVRVLRLLGIPGSARRDSRSRAVLEAARALLPEGVMLEVFELDGLPPFNHEMSATPAARISEFKRQIRAADAVLFAAPEYRYSMLSVLNNAIDSTAWPYGESAWVGKPVAVFGVHDGPGAPAPDPPTLRLQLAALQMRPLPQAELLIENASQAFDPEGRLHHADARAGLARLLASLAAWTRQLQASSTSP